MLALKLLLTVAGALLLAAAVAIPLYGLWLRLQLARKKAGRGRNDGRKPQLNRKRFTGGVRWRWRSGWAACRCWWPRASWWCPAAWAACASARCAARCRERSIPACTSSRRSWTACRLFDLRDHLFTAGLVEQGAKKTPAACRLERAVARRAEHRPRRHGALPARSQQAGQRAGAPAAAGGQGTGASGGGQRVARTDAAVHGEGDLLHQARRSARQGGRDHHAQARRPTASWWKR